MAKSQNPKNSSENYRDQLSTVSESGSRLWVYPKKQKGKHYWRRTIVAVLLLLLFLTGPFIKVNGEPFLLFNVLKKEFIIIGFPFTLQDTFLFAVFMLTSIVLILLFTVIYGRIFCGWLCPQTVFMEHIFRRIEYMIEGDANKSRRLDKQGWTKEKIWKKGLKWSIFFLIAVIIANFFLMYILGADEVLQLILDPLNHLGGLSAMLIFSFVFFMVFANLRDQVCTTICPYGRLQGVFLDRNSIVVSYDFERGEPRGRKKKKKKKKNEVIPLVNIAATASLIEEEKEGDCVACDLCVKVCPTGIDIRNGTQMECINCTLCIDACDDIMVKVKKPKGLIRFASYNSIVNKTNQTNIFNARTIAYSLVMVALMGFLGYLLTSRTSVKLYVQRTRGSIFMKVDDNHGKNFYTYQIINKTRKTIPVEVKILGKDGQLDFIGVKELILEPKGRVEGSVFLTLDIKDIEGYKTPIKLGLFAEGKQVEVIEVGFLGPDNS